MRSLKPWLCSLFLTLGCSVIAQNDADTSLTAAVEHYIDLTETGDLRGCMDMVHPVLYTMVPKEKVMEAIEEAKGQEGFPRFENGRITRTTGPLVEGDRRFAVVEYAFTMLMALPWDSTLSAEEQAESDGMVVEMMGTTYGEKHVRWNSHARQLSIDDEKAMYAILDPEIGAWRFLERKPGGEELVAKVIPEKILKKLDR